MNERTIAVIALSNRDFPDFQAKLREAAHWVERSARQGADLAVLPEALNLYRGDGPGNPDRPTLGEAATDDWQRDCAVLIETAQRERIAVAVPVFERIGPGALANVFYLVDADGTVLGRYQKMYPTPSEMDEGVQPAGEQPLIDWHGIRVGGAICFDTCFPDAIEAQARAGAQLILVPSLWPGGTQLDHLARTQEVVVALAYPAWSRVIDLDGTELAATGYRNETLRFGFGQPIAMATVNFDRVRLYANHNQERIAAVQAACGRDVRVRFDQPNCSFYLESRSPNTTAAQVVERFGLVPFRAYFEQCRRKRDNAVVEPGSPIVHVRRLVADGRHNAFTDLRAWNGALYLTYRRSSGHGETDGDLVLMRSHDQGETWQELDSTLRATHNFYEGHLAELDSRLLVYSGSFRRGGPLDKTTMQHYVSWSEDGATWSKPTPTYEAGWRLWRPIRVGDALFATAYRADYSQLQPNGIIPARAWTVRLIRSRDGITWEDVATLSDRHGGNETELVLEADGTLRAFMRCEAPPCHLLELHSTPPYTHWSEPRDAGQVVQGQTVRTIDGRRFMIGRHRPCHGRNGTIDERRDWIRTKIWVQERGYWIDYATLPSGGDTSYAGAVALGQGRMLVSYYSQHERVDEPGFQDMGGASDIYLATVRTDAAATWGRLAHRPSENKTKREIPSQEAAHV